MFAPSPYALPAHPTAVSCSQQEPPNSHPQPVAVQCCNSLQYCSGKTIIIKKWNSGQEGPFPTTPGTIQGPALAVDPCLSTPSGRSHSGDAVLPAKNPNLAISIYFLSCFPSHFHRTVFPNCMCFSSPSPNGRRSYRV